MGSSHLACMVSNFPITPGDKVKVIFLKEMTGHGTTNPDSYWRPIGIPLSGEYDDYGRVEVPNNKFAKDYLVKYIAKRHIPVAQGPNSVHDLPVPHIETYEDIVDAEFNGRLFLKTNPGYGPQPGEDPVFFNRGLNSQVRMVLIREDIWNEMLKYTTEGFLDEGMLGTKHFFDTYIKAHREVQVEHLVNPERKFFNYKVLQKCENHLPVEQKDVIRDLVEPEPQQAFEPNAIVAMKMLAEFATVNLFMTDHRMTWHPTTSAGSQEQEFLARAKFNAAVAQVAIKYEIEEDVDWGNYGPKATEDLKKALKMLEEAKALLENIKHEE